MSKKISMELVIAVLNVSHFRVICFSLVFIFLSAHLSAQTPGKQTYDDQPVSPEQGTVDASGKFSPAPKNKKVAPVPDPVARLAELGIKLEGEDVTIGQVKLNRKSRSISFPAKVHAVSGVLEYALVHSSGKIHETLFVTDATPQDIHVACLLAGWGESKKKKGASIIVEVVWDSNGPQRRDPIEFLVAYTKGSPEGKQVGHMALGPWKYKGSRVDAAGFAATREGSIISLIQDPAALVTNLRPVKKDNSIHVPHSRLLPPLGSTVTIVFRPSPVSPMLPKTNNQTLSR